MTKKEVFCLPIVINRQNTCCLLIAEAQNKAKKGCIAMKKLYLISGTMGVGKSAVCEILNKKLPNSVYLDGDWCWNADPFVVTDETKTMVHDNIVHILNNFIKCSVYKNIIFCWVMHEQFIVDKILNSIDASCCEVLSLSRTCDEASLRHGLEKDIECGKRAEDIIERSVVRLPLYEKLNTIKIDTSSKTAEVVAEDIIYLKKIGA